MRAFARLTHAAGSFELAPGDLIGRIPAAALRIDDPRISEAHALVSLRRGALYLLSLRRLLAVAGAPTSEVQLTAGLVIELAAGVELRVDDVVLPTSMLAVRGRSLERTMLAPVTSLHAGPPLSAIGRFVPSADAHLWSAGTSWRLRRAGQPDRDVGAGDRFAVGGEEVELCAVPLAGASPPSTAAGGSIDDPLHIVAHYDTVEIHRRGRATVTINGQSANVLSELIAFNGPVAWETVARELWRDGIDVHELRHRWDVALSRLRRRLRVAKIRTDLVVSDRAGQLQVRLGARDVVEDRS